MGSLKRETKETRIRVAISAAGTAAKPASEEAGGASSSITTDDAFLTHMLVTLAKYARLPLTVEATGDLRHHLIEDVAITLGTLLGEETPATCVRYGDATIPMDDALVQVVVDTGGRPHYQGELPSDLYEHFFRSLALNANWTVHVRVIRGRDRHHVVEAAFKALGMAMAQALADRGTDGAVFSTKGSVATEWEGDLDEAGELGPAPDPSSPDAAARTGASGPGPEPAASEEL